MQGDKSISKAYEPRKQEKMKVILLDTDVLRPQIIETGGAAGVVQAY